MKRAIFTALLVLGLLAFTALGTADITKSNHKLKTQDIKIQSKQSELQLLELKFNKLNVDLQKELSNKTQDQERVEELQRQKDELQKQLDEAQRQLQARAAQKEAERQKLASAASLSSTAYAEGSCEAWIAGAGIKEVASAKELIRRESNCNPNARNPSSGACGVAQELPCGKSGCSLGDGACQVKWMNGYVISRYGSWAGAVAFHDANNWY